MIWKRQTTLEQLNRLGEGNMVGLLDIRFETVTDDTLEATMPVDSRTQQPFGLLHGGASVVLAETVASVAGAMTVDPATHATVGMEINANHIRPASSGWVTGTARAVHIGRTTQVWQIDSANEAGDMVCVSRITMAVLAPR